MEAIYSFFAGSKTEFTNSEEIVFYIHEGEHRVKASDVYPETTLNEYLRETLQLTGTKKMCLEGGCGSCVVAVTAIDPVTEREVLFSVNSCLVPIYSCSGWKIHTVEALGNPTVGYHPIQNALIKFSGTQCGFCTSGMLMNMYPMYEKNSPTMKNVENAFGGNICRCTGYRPILEAFKSLASDATQGLKCNSADIEDIPLCKKGDCEGQCKQQLLEVYRQGPLIYNLEKSKWVKVFAVNEILDVLKDNPEASYMLVGGNTASGVYQKPSNLELYVDISNVKPLRDHELKAETLDVGANMPLTNAMELFYNTAKRPNFAYLKKVADHIDLIANVPVRNVGTLAGNLSIKHEHNEFPSDVFLCLETVGATLTIVGTDRKETTTTPAEYLNLNMKGKIIKTITFPALDESYKYESYKIMPRAQNAHAHVNAGFLLKLNQENVVESARIVYGCINPSFTHATETETYLKGKNLFDNATLQGAFENLDKELQPDHVLPDPSPGFRKQLAISLFYKYLLSIAPDGKISPRNKSGGEKLERPISTGVQEFQTNQSVYPVTKPIPKLEALAQASGKAEYVLDIPDQPGQLYAAFVLAKAAPGSIIESVDKSEALKLQGVVAYLDKNDVPGENTFTPKESGFGVNEELFCSGTVKFFFQTVGIVVATSQKIAEEAAELVKLTYKEPTKKPLLTIREILAADAQDKIVKDKEIKAKTKGDDVKHVIKGTFDCSYQYHYQMETQCCLVVPTEDGYDMYPSTQSMDFAQVAASQLIKVPMNKINVKVRRLGGGFGSKISRNSLVSCAAILASSKLRKPVKLWMPFMVNMNVVGKRVPCTSDYEVGVNNEGVIQYLNCSIYSDLGSEGGNESVLAEVFPTVLGSYNADTWTLKAFTTRSDNPTSTWCRAPGTTEGLGLIETIMDHIASVTNLDSTQVRIANMSSGENELKKHITDLKGWADVDNRIKEVEKFNQDNRWVKRGLATVVMTYPFSLFGNFNAQVSVYAGDGSVSITHAGIEMGQGINTKIAQVCAYALGIPLDQVAVKPSNVFVSPNATTTGGSVTSESVCYAVIKACDSLKARMQPVKTKMVNPSWKDLVKQCAAEFIELSATFMSNPSLPDFHSYKIYGVAACEAEVDLLTGNHQLRRVDILEDAGNSMSPLVDVGQVEGAFVMGIGYWTTEQLVFSDKGELLTNRTWSYKPPGAKDIPVDFRLKFPQNNPNPIGVLNSKATAEPPLCMTCCVPLAIRKALSSARLEADAKSDKWYPISGPSTVESTFLNSLHDYKQYVL